MNEIVVVRIKRIDNMGAYATLLEYGGKEGMVILSEVSKRTLPSAQAPLSKLLRVGRTLVCTALAVDREKGYTDLSKRRVDLPEASVKEQAFSRAKAVHSVMCHVATKNEIGVEELCKKVSWPLFKQYGDAFAVLRRHLLQEINLWTEINFSTPGQNLSSLADVLKKDIEECLRKRLTQQRVALRAKFEVISHAPDGIELIQKALRVVSEVRRPECTLKVRLIAHPIFSIDCFCLDRDVGISAIDVCLALIEDSILSSEGFFRLRAHPELPDQELVCEGEETYALSGVVAVTTPAAHEQNTDDGSTSDDSREILVSQPVCGHNSEP